MNQDQKERYVRWQNYRITQLSFSINLFLGFAVASLAYAINIKLGETVHQALPLNCVMIVWSFSAGFGCVATVSRLLDYHYTAKKIKEGGSFNTFMAKWSGPVTWGFFWLQILAYIVGAYFFIQGVVNA